MSKFIQQCFYPEFEKAAAIVGEERIWNGVKYKKIAQGRWVKVTEGKSKVSEREIKPTSLKKTLAQEIKNKQLEKQKHFEEIKKQWEAENGEINQSVRQKVSFDKYLSQFQPYKEFWDEVDLTIKDLQDEISEILDFEKQERERISGRKEVGVSDSIYKDFESNFNSQRRDFVKTDDYTTAKKALGEKVSVQDYYLSTSTLFKNHLNIKDKDWDYEAIDQEWERLKQDPDLVHTHSPKSSSEYLVNHKTGDVYRLADHWGRCASCEWDYDRDSSYGIGKSNVKDFKRNDNGYVNRDKIKKGLEFCQSQLEKIKQLKQEVDFDKDVEKDLKKKTTYIQELLSKSLFYKDLEESKKILEEYKNIINI